MTPDDQHEALLERTFQAVFPAPLPQTGASWSRFHRHTLPEKQAWVAYHVTVSQAHARLKTITRWTHRTK